MMGVFDDNQSGGISGVERESSGKKGDQVNGGQFRHLN